MTAGMSGKKYSHPALVIYSQYDNDDICQIRDMIDGALKNQG